MSFWVDLGWGRIGILDGYGLNRWAKASHAGPRLSGWLSFRIRADSNNSPSGCGSKLIRQGTAGFSLWFHLPGFHFGVTLFLTHSQIFAIDTQASASHKWLLRLRHGQPLRQLVAVAHLQRLLGNRSGPLKWRISFGFVSETNQRGSIL